MIFFEPTAMENGENGTKIPTISEAAREQNVRPKVMGTHIRIFLDS